MSRGSNRKLRPPRSRAMVITATITFALLVITALVFTISQSTHRITEHAVGLHLTDNSLRVTTVAASKLGFAVHALALDAQFNTNFEAAIQAATEEGREALDALDSAVAQFPAAGITRPELHNSASRYIETGHILLTLIEAGNIEQAKTITEEDLAQAFTDFSQLLVIERDQQFELVTASDAASGRLGDIARFILALMFPLASLLVYREIIKRQQRQAELEMRLDAERQLSKARDDFVANASHELRTPLTSIYGLGRLLDDDPTLTGMQREMVGLINSESSDLDRMVEDLLTTARLAAGQLRFEPRDIEVVDETEAFLAPFQNKGKHLTHNAEQATVHVDQLRQRQIIRNLISNAVKYGGDHIHLEGTVQAPWYHWTVSDNGDGIPPEMEERLFQRFIHQQSFQQAVAGGVGLGLSIVKSLAEGIGGTVTYHRDEKTHFTVTVPLTATLRSAEATTDQKHVA